MLSHVITRVLRGGRLQFIHGPSDSPNHLATRWPARSRPAVIPTPGVTVRRMETWHADLDATRTEFAFPHSCSLDRFCRSCAGTGPHHSGFVLVPHLTETTWPDPLGVSAQMTDCARRDRCVNSALRAADWVRPGAGVVHLSRGGPRIVAQPGPPEHPRSYQERRRQRDSPEQKPNGQPAHQGLCRHRNRKCHRN